jgi:glutamate racemase
VQQQPIAILDSGVGGLTVVKEVMRQLPREKIVYFGDTARTPYGPRSADEILLFTYQIVKYLYQYHPKMIVIACNTATAVALDAIRSCVSIPVIGVINPGARAAVKTTRNNRIGVIGTEGTIKSNAYEKALHDITPNVEVVSQACPQLVPLVEKGFFRNAKTRRIIEESLAPLKSKAMDCLILGCTHYPFLSEVIADVMGPEVTLINSAEETARDISAILNYKAKLAKADASPIHQFFCSGDPATFKKIAELWLNEEIKVMPVVWQVPHII